MTGEWPLGAIIAAGILLGIFLVEVAVLVGCWWVRNDAKKELE